MIGLDTNVLVRYLVRDDAVQFEKAIELIERRLGVDEPGFVSVVAMAELVWVLDRAYGFSDSEIAAAIERTLQTESLVVESENEVFAAMIALREGRGSFGDALIAALGVKAGCAHTLTFDRKALRLPGFAQV
ncbi:MAG TPA: type II toxin-antitoxin system VapC family toxin [Stellaceae bacterium]|nr:type II toxin-antitoxin system VapC family toxin [Stellaceae bacterium]